MGQLFWDQNCHLVCCVRWRQWKQKCHDDSETHNWMTANTKLCPKCSKPVEKNGGCNLVVCRCGQVASLPRSCWNFCYCHPESSSGCRNMALNLRRNRLPREHAYDVACCSVRAGLPFKSSTELPPSSTLHFISCHWIWLFRPNLNLQILMQALQLSSSSYGHICDISAPMPLGQYIHLQSFCWLCGASTGIRHTWQEISGHSCGRFKEDLDRKIDEAAWYEPLKLMHTVCLGRLNLQLLVRPNNWRQHHMKGWIAEG